MPNVIDWMRETATFMVNDRPDVYDHETAVAELSHNVDWLRREDRDVFSAVAFASYVLLRFMEDGVEEFTLTKKISSVLIEPEAFDAYAYRWADGLDLPHVTDEREDWP